MDSQSCLPIFEFPTKPNDFVWIEMAMKTSSGVVKPPKNALIAYAIALVRSKPPEFTNRDYLRAIAQHFAKGRRVDALSSTYHHLDRSSWWRSEYERQKLATTAAEDEVLELKLEIDRLKSRLESANLTKKRKKVDEDVVPVPRSPKRSKPKDSSAKKSSANAEGIAEFDFSGIGEVVGNILMRSFYQVNAILKSNQKTDAALLAHECVRAAAAIPQVVQKALQIPDSTSTVDADDLKLVLTACSRAIVSLIMGLTRLTDVADGNQVQGKVTYAYVSMYAKLVDILLETSKREAANAETQASSEIESTKPSSKAKGTQPRKSATMKTNSTLSVISIFLCSIIDNLNSKVEAHKSLFEGFAFTILEKLGSCMYMLTFGHPRGETLEAEIANAGKTDEIADGDSETPSELALKSAKLEAPYLVHLLSRIMTAAAAHLGGMTSAKTGKARVANVSSSVKGALAIEAKNKLQRMLVNCTFGTEGMDESHPLMDCLKKPAISDVAVSIPKIKEVEVQDWFKEEVWRLLGWEILSKEGES